MFLCFFFNISLSFFKNEVKKIASNRDPGTASIYNKAHAMRYELEDQHLKRLRELMPKLKGQTMLQ